MITKIFRYITVSIFPKKVPVKTAVPKVTKMSDEEPPKKIEVKTDKTSHAKSDNKRILIRQLIVGWRTSQKCRDEDYRSNKSDAEGIVIRQLVWRETFQKICSKDRCTRKLVGRPSRRIWALILVFRHFCRWKKTWRVLPLQHGIPWLSLFWWLHRICPMMTILSSKLCTVFCTRLLIRYQYV